MAPIMAAPAGVLISSINNYIHVLFSPGFGLGLFFCLDTAGLNGPGFRISNPFIDPGVFAFEMRLLMAGILRFQIEHYRLVLLDSYRAESSGDFSYSCPADNLNRRLRGFSLSGI